MSRLLMFPLLLLVALAGISSGQEMSMQAGFLDEFAVVGGPARFVVVVQLELPADSKSAPEVKTPSLPAVEGLEYSYQGGDFQQTGSSTVIINGRRSGSINYSGRYTWKISGASEGLYRMPVVAIEVGGKVYRCQPDPGALRVGKEAPGNRYVGVAVAVDHTDPYVNQPVRLRWVLSSEKVIVQTNESVPELDIPWAGSPPGFLATPTETAGRQDRNAVYVNLGGERQRLKTEVREDRKPPVIEVSLDKVLIPLAPGTIDLGGTSVGLEVAERQRRVFGGSDYDGKMKAFVRTDPIVLTVRDAPTAGRPTSYRGAIGDFDVKLSYGSGKIRAGDGVTLNLTLTGSDVVDLIAAPDVAADFPNCRALFSGKDAAGEGATRRLTYSWLIKPLDDKMTELPRFEYSWFRPRSERFETALLESLPLEISGELEEGEVFGGADRAARKAIAVLGEGLRPPVREPGRMRPLRPTIAPGWFLLVLVGPLLSFGLTAVLLRRRRALHGDLNLQRKRKASKAAQTRLDEARALLGQKGFHTRLARTLSSFVADKLGVPPASVTAATVRQLLGQAQASQGLTDEIASFLDQLDHAAFGSRQAEGATSEAATLARAEELLARLDREIRS